MKSHITFSISTALLAVFLLVPNNSLADRFIFVINTTEQDDGGPVTTPYLDEARWMKKWNEVLSEHQNRESQIRIIPIRANSNQEITKALEFWMTPTETSTSEHEVLGLAVYSHGYRMVLLNESQKFLLNLPDDIESVFRPILGHFSPNARIILTGCEVLQGQSSMTTLTSLQTMANAFGLKDGIIYANESKGLDPHTLFADPLNSDIKIQKRMAALGTYLLWPISSALVPLMSKFVYNQGFALEIRGNTSQLLKVEEDKIFQTSN